MGRKTKKETFHYQIDDNKWNVGEKEKRGLRKGKETAIIIAIIRQNQSEEQVNEYLDELEFLAETAGAKIKKKFIQ